MSVDANEQANPISLGMVGDYGATLTVTGFDNLMAEEDPSEAMVMSKVDWIVALRQAYYEVLSLQAPDQGAAATENRIDAESLLRNLATSHERLKLVPREEYAVS